MEFAYQVGGQRDRERFGNVFISCNLIRDVERSDEGQYMCQINTARAKTRLGNLHVVGK